MGLRGFESDDKTREKAASADRRARCATIQPPIALGFRFIVDRWQGLTEPVKAAILAIVRAAGG
tara:strand:- start:92 stop:283 length:192 start_codon:yes stop_codon:yes gene_type:complete